MASRVVASGPKGTDVVLRIRGTVSVVCGSGGDRSVGGKATLTQESCRLNYQLYSSSLTGSSASTRGAIIISYHHIIPPWVPIAIMNRLFGTKSAAPRPTLDGAISKVSFLRVACSLNFVLTSLTQVDDRISSLDVKLSALNSELSAYQAKLAKMRDGPGKNALRQKALKVLQRRKQYEAQRDQLSQQSWNMEQAGMMQDNLKNVMTTVDAMKTTTKELKKQYGKVDIDKIEQMQDEMADLMEVGNEIQESISRAYDLPEEVDEADLDAELEALGEESMFESEMGEGAVPSFLQDEVAPPQFIDEPPEQPQVKEAAGGVG